MLRLNLKREPYWIDLPAGVRLYIRPLSTAIMSSSQNSAIKEIGTLRAREKDHSTNDHLERDDAPLSIENEETRLGLSESLLIKALARSAIIKWEGVLEADGNNIAHVVDKNINDLMDIWFIAQDFWKQYTGSLSMLEYEGNTSEPELNCTSMTSPVTVKDLKRKSFHVVNIGGAY